MRELACEETYITICKIDSQWEFAVWVSWDGEGDGREVQEGGDICMPMADSCCSLTENNKIL